MTDKRFTIEKKGGVFYIFDNGNLIPISDGQPICDLLEGLHEENEQLKQRIKELELLNDGLNYALKNIRKIDVEIDVGDEK